MCVCVCIFIRHYIVIIKLHHAYGRQWRKSGTCIGANAIGRHHYMPEHTMAGRSAHIPDGIALNIIIILGVRRWQTSGSKRVSPGTSKEWERISISVIISTDCFIVGSVWHLFINNSARHRPGYWVGATLSPLHLQTSWLTMHTRWWLIFIYVVCF